MTPPQCTNPTASRTDPFRWDRPTIASTHDYFQDPDHGSQRQYAREQGIPRSTVGSWLRDDPSGASATVDLEPELVSFFRSSVGLRFLRRVVLALFLVFLFGGACGLRRLSLFLRRTGLDYFVASSTGALHDLAGTIQTDLGRFAEEERPRLAEGMKHRHIALVPDENFHGPHVCLVAAEPVSNFLLVEQYATQRDEKTWTAAIEQATRGLNVTVLLLSSDQARGIIACAHNGLGAAHLPELFHGQRDLCQGVMGPLQRQKEAALKELQQAQEQLPQAGSSQSPLPEHDPQFVRKQQRVAEASAHLKQCVQRQEQALQAVRGVGDDYHPFDSRTGARVGAALVRKRLGKRLGKLEQVAEQAQLGEKAQKALTRGKRWVESLVAAMAWFWMVTRICVEELDLPKQAEQVVYERLLPGLYWQQAASRARTAEERQQKEELARRLVAQAWRKGGPLSRLPAEQQEEVQRVAREVVGLFARSSSCVEGRNGRLALFHHGQTRLNPGRLKALTVIHNYLTERHDGTTAAQRFFGKKPRDLFDWLWERLPDLPQPAARRPKPATQPTPKPG
jgi:hypothetical protein